MYIVTFAMQFPTLSNYKIFWLLDKYNESNPSLLVKECEISLLSNIYGQEAKYDNIYMCVCEGGGDV